MPSARDRIDPGTAGGLPAVPTGSVGTYGLADIKGARGALCEQAEAPRDLSISVELLDGARSDGPAAPIHGDLRRQFRR